MKGLVLTFLINYVRKSEIPAHITARPGLIKLRFPQNGNFDHKHVFQI